jgi:hypothetical protein
VSTQDEELARLEAELRQADIEVRDWELWRREVHGRRLTRHAPLHGTGESARRRRGMSSYDDTNGDLWDLVEDARRAPEPATGPPKSSADFEIEYDIADRELGRARARRNRIRAQIAVLRRPAKTKS